MSNSGPKYALAIHGGAGVISGDDKEALQAAEEGLAAALSAGVMQTLPSVIGRRYKHGPGPQSAST